MVDVDGLNIPDGIRILRVAKIDPVLLIGYCCVSGCWAAAQKTVGCVQWLSHRHGNYLEWHRTMRGSYVE